MNGSRPPRRARPARSLVGMVVLVFVVATGGGADEPGRFRARAAREGDRVEVRDASDRAVFVVHSARGIGEATIVRTGDGWPDSVTVRLRLRGLESFEVSHERRKLSASVSSDSGEVRQWKDGREEELLAADSRFAMHVRAVRDGDPTKDSYFDVRLPKALFEGNPRAIVLRWIDFYRN